MEPDEIEQLDGEELVQKWQEQNKAYHFEGESGVKKLEDLCETLGYQNSGFRFGDPIQQFLCDNPGACEKIVEFIAEWTDRNGDWHERLSDATEEGDDA